MIPPLPGLKRLRACLKIVATDVTRWKGSPLRSIRLVTSAATLSRHSPNRIVHPFGASLAQASLSVMVRLKISFEFPVEC